MRPTAAQWDLYPPKPGPSGPVRGVMSSEMDELAY